jgi:hypothetical protein
MMKFYNTGIFVLVTLFVFASCRKGKDGDNTDLTQVIINNTGEIVSNDVFKMYLYNMITVEDSIFYPNDSLNFHYFEPCLQVSISPIDTMTWPKTITLAFPESGCYCQDGNIRGGQMAITASGLFSNPGSAFNIILSNYTVNGITVSGNKKLTVTKVSSGKPVLFKDSCEFQINSLSENKIWISGHLLQWILGYTSESNLADDLFIYSGTSQSDSFSGIISDALQFRNYCFWIGSGKIEITPTGLSKRQVTYPDSCLNQANVLLNNETYQVNF